MVVVRLSSPGGRPLIRRRRVPTGVAIARRMPRPGGRIRARSRRRRRFGRGTRVRRAASGVRTRVHNRGGHWGNAVLSVCRRVERRGSAPSRKIFTGTGKHNQEPAGLSPDQRNSCDGFADRTTDPARKPHPRSTSERTSDGMLSLFSQGRIGARAPVHVALTPPVTGSINRIGLVPSYRPRQPEPSEPTRITNARLETRNPIRETPRSARPLFAVRSSSYLERECPLRFSPTLPLRICRRRHRLLLPPLLPPRTTPGLRRRRLYPPGPKRLPRPPSRLPGRES